MNAEETIRDICERYNKCSELMNERQRRLWAAEEAIRLGRGGISLVSKSLRISPNTIKKGIGEISNGETASSSGDDSRIRKRGGGRKPKTP